ncbi:hypothetical protein AAKU55_002910 [Oxalobacteraceae bacterium GrIS 1.11]
MTMQTMFTPNSDGFDVSPAGALLLIAGTAYGDPSETTPEGMRNSHAFIGDVLAAARAGGYTQGDVLHTLLSRNKHSPRITAMAQAAVDAAGSAAMRKVFAKHRL